MTKIIDKIHLTGYWIVKIRPTVFNEEKIPTLNECRKIVEHSSVLLRGWDYPHYDNNQVKNAIDFVTLEVDFMKHVEVWRQYQSGQFVHHFACIEDYLNRDTFSQSLSIHSPSDSGRYLSILSSLYTLTEIFLFASRLASKQVMDPSCEISITLNSMKNRQLFFFDRGRLLRRSYICDEDILPFSKIYSITELMSDYASHARIALQWFFERFNWNEITEGFFFEEQSKYLERNV